MKLVRIGLVAVGRWQRLSRFVGVGRPDFARGSAPVAAGL